MSEVCPSGTGSHPPFKKPTHPPPEMPTYHNRSNPINNTDYPIEIMQSSMISQLNVPFLESDSWQEAGLIASHRGLSAGRDSDWQVPGTSLYGFHNTSSALNAPNINWEYWESDKPSPERAREYWMANENNAASLDFYSDFGNYFPYPVNAFDESQSCNQNFDSTHSSQSAELDENTSFGSVDNFNGFLYDDHLSHWAVMLMNSTVLDEYLLSGSAPPSMSKSNEDMNFRTPSSYTSGLAGIDTSQEYQVPRIVNSSQISLVEPSSETYLRQSGGLSHKEDSLAYKRYTQRPPMILTRSFDLSNSAKDEILNPSSKPEWEIVVTPQRNIKNRSSGRIPLSGSPIPKPYKTGRRQGPLHREIAKRALAMRHRRACWSCWLSKVTCSIEEECHRCKNTRPNLFRGIVCSRSCLADYANLFFPDVLISHLHEARIQELIEKNVLEFTDGTFNIEVSSGEIFPTMDLSLRRFIPRNKDFLFLNRLEKQCNGQVAMIQKHSLPVGLPAADVTQLKEKCLSHIKAIIAEDQSLEKRSCDEISEIRWRVLRAIDCYRKSSSNKNVRVLKKAVMLREMHAFMGRSLSIVNGEDLSDSLETLPRTANQKYNMDVPSTLLNREIKHAMHLLLQETTRQVLTLLEKELKERTKAAWAPCFCTILILTMCSEDLRIALDGFAVHTQSQGSRKEPLSRAHGFQIALQLDNRLLADCKALFHAIFKLSNEGMRAKIENVFNPLRDGLDVDGSDGLPQEVHVLVEDISDLLTSHGHEMAEYTREPSLEDGDDTMESHMDFRQRNSGRLVSAFLRSFLESSP